MISAIPNHQRRSVGSMRNLLSILDGDLADGRTTLAAASCDIERAASYCGENYMKGQKDGKLDNTMAFATQSLGTVAFQISRLASHFLEAIDMQSDMLGEISDRIEKLRMVCNIHQEKVSRKAIGSCTNPKVPIIFQHDCPHPEPPQKYIRRPIDYSLLDSVGHGVRTQDPVLNQYGVPVLRSNTIQRRSSGSTSVPGQGAFVRQHSTISCRTSGTKSTIEYAAPMHSSNTMRYQSGTLGRTAGIYRTAVVPPQHLLGADTLHPHSSGGGSSPAAGSLSSSNYAPGGAAMAANLASNDVANAAALVGQSNCSSGSSSLGSSAQHAMASTSQLMHKAHTQAQQSVYGQPFPGSHVPVVQSKVIYSTGEPNAAAVMQIRQQHLQDAQNMQSNPMAMQHHAQTPGYQVAHTELTAAQQQYAQHKQQQQQHQASIHAMQSTGIPHNLIPMEPPSTINSHMTGHAQQNYAKSVNQIPAALSPTAVTSLDNIPVPPPEAYAGQAPSTPSHNYMGAEIAPLTNDAHSGTGDVPSSAAPSGLIARKPEDPAWAPDYYMEKVITMYEYVRDKDDELTFTENQIIYVIKKNDDGWWEGVMNGITGLFPGNYVELYD